MGKIIMYLKKIRTNYEKYVVIVKQLNKLENCHINISGNTRLTV